MTDATPSGMPFDLDRLKELIGLMEQHDLSEVDLHNGDQRCRLRRGPQNVMPMYPTGGYAAPAPAPTGVGAAPSAAAAPVSDGTILIKSPTVGTFYSSPSPDDPAFVQVGTHVQDDTIVCLIEAMKVYNQITADVKGTVTEVLVKNAEPVEFNQPLFRVRPD